MARDLVKIGREGFAIVDKCFPKGKAAPPPHQQYNDHHLQKGYHHQQQQYNDQQLQQCQYQYYPQQPKTHQVIQIPLVTHKVIEYYEAPRAGECYEAPRAVDCYEAAHLYGGTLLVDYSKRNQHQAAYWSR